MIQKLLYIGFGGFFGAISRYLVYMLTENYYHRTNFPLGTLVVNLIGSFLIGIALGLSYKFNILSRGQISHYIFVTGFLGAFTTFSTFTQDNFILFANNQINYAIFNIIISLLGGIILFSVGYYSITRLLE